MNKPCFLITALAIALLLIPLAGFADSGKFGLGLRGGLYKSNDADNTILYGGVQARWKVFPALSIEGTLDYRPSESYPNNRKVTSYPILVSALFYPMPGAKYSPYLLGGAGWYYSQIEDIAGSSTTYTPGLHLGGGLDIPLSPALVFNADIRYYFINYGDQKVKDLNMDGTIISAGLTFYLW
ncbi:MAG: outer membrane beta-barrel protein [Deltaproteobacteria bacterium]|nr:outer membrane beta-barrel protein [Deltaproteobacteria bacterium]